MARPPSSPPPAAHPAQPPEHSPARYVWALLLARLSRDFASALRAVRGRLRIIAFVIDAPAVKTILAHLGEPTSPPEVAPARGPPLWDQMPEPVAHFADTPAPEPEFVFDQPLSW